MNDHLHRELGQLTANTESFGVWLLIALELFAVVLLFYYDYI